MTLNRVAACILFLSPPVPAQSLQDSQVKLDEAMKLASSGQLDRAGTALAKLAGLHPGHAEIRYRLGIILLRQKKLAEASVEIEKAAQLDAKSPLVWLALAQVRLQQGNRALALAAAGRAHSLAPANREVRRALGMLHTQIAAEYRQRKNPAKAVEEYQRAIELDPDQPAFYAALAQVFLDHRTPEPAVAVLERAVARFPADTEILRLLGIAQYGTGNVPKALNAFLRVTDLAPDSEAGYASLETLLPEAGARIGEIAGKLRGFLERMPSSAVGHFLLAQALSVLSPGDKEIEGLLRKAIALEAGFWPAHFELHKPLLQRQELGEAARTLERTIEINPDFAAAHYSLAQIYAQQGDRVRAAEQRRSHHEVVSRQREAAEVRRAEAPMLPYKILTR